MAMQTFSHEEWQTGDEPIRTTEVVLASGQGVIPARTPIGLVIADGEFKMVDLSVSDGSQVATRMTVYDVDTTSGAKTISAYKVGTFNPAMVNWPVSFDTDAKKAGAFVGTPISLQTPRVI